MSSVTRAIPPQLACALRLHQQFGFSVIPLHARTKRAAVRWREFQQRRATVAELHQWWRWWPLANPGVITGEISQLTVVDADTPEAFAEASVLLPPTPGIVHSTRGGHLYFGPGAVRSRGHVRLAGGTHFVEVRARGNLVCGPGSWHRSGARYRAPHKWPAVLDLPVFDEAWLEPEPPPPPPRPPSASISALPVLDRARKYVAALPVPVIGSGSDAATLYAAARLVRGFNLDPADAEALLWDWCGTRPGWTRAWVATKVANALRLTHGEPFGGLL